MKRLALLFLILSAGAAGGQTVLRPVHYDLAVQIDVEAETLAGTARIRVRNSSSAPAQEASLLLYRMLHANAVRDGRGAAMQFRQAVVSFTDFPVRQVNQVVVVLPRTLPPGGETVIEVGFDGRLRGYVETGELYIKDRIDAEFTILRDDAYAYPRPGVPSTAINRDGPMDAFTYSARITVPIGLVVANGGRRVGVDTTGRAVTYGFTSLKPSWRMDFAIAQYGEVLAGPFRVYHLPSDSEGAARVAAAAERALGLYTAWFGPRPDPTTLTFIEIPDGWGSQTDATAIIQSAAAFKDPRQLREVYHEVSHLWGVSPLDRPSPRWEEGLASFLEYLVSQEVSGTPLVDARANQLLAWLRGELPTHQAWRSVPLVDYGKSRMTDLSYSVGALFFDLLYRLGGRDGFNRIVGEYCRSFGVKGGRTIDFIAIVRKTGSPILADLVNDWMVTTQWAERVEVAGDIAGMEAYYRRPK